MAEGVQRYFHDLTSADNEVLNREEEKELARRAKAGDREAREELIEHNLRLAVDVASNYRNLGLDYSDLIQAGNLGLLKAIERFDPELGYKFSTYAYWWIKQAILRTLDNESRTVNVPVHLSNLKRKVGQISRDYRDREGEEPDIEKLAEKLDASEKKIKRAIRAERKTKSLDRPLGGGKGERTLVEMVEREQNLSPAERIADELARERLYQLMEEELTDRERRVLKLRFGLEDYQPRTLAEVGEVFDLSRERIRQLQEQALEKLRKPELEKVLVRNI